MPIISERDAVFPGWSKLKRFSVHTAREGETIEFSGQWSSTAVFVLSGRLFITADHQEYTLNSWQSPTDGLILKTGNFTAKTYSSVGFWRDRCTFCVFHGDWKDARVDLFRVDRCDQASIPGPAAAYDKNTCYPDHADGFDQAWLIAKGHGIIHSGGNFYPAETGNLMLIPAGETHDFAVAHSYTECVRLSMR